MKLPKDSKDIPDGTYIECKGHGAIGVVRNRRVVWLIPGIDPCGAMIHRRGDPSHEWQIDNLTGGVFQNILRIVSQQEVTLLLLGH